MTLGKEAATLSLRKGMRAQGARLDRFGLFTSDAGGQLVRIFLDDLRYTADLNRLRRAVYEASAGMRQSSGSIRSGPTTGT